MGAWLLRVILLGLEHTCRLEIVEGREHVERALGEKRPYILSFWHNRSFPATVLVRELLRQGLEILVLASLSRDGELVSRLARMWGLSVVRGSASRGGREAVRAIYRGVKRGGASPVMIPDGPRGPLYEFKMGVAVVAQMSQAPILPIGMAASSFFRIKSWDRLIVPWPFSRIAVVVGEPQGLDRSLSSPELEEERRRLEDLLNELTRRAEEHLGVADSSRDG